MQNRRIWESLRLAVIKYAKRFRLIRYSVIAVVAVSLFFCHLVRNRKWQWKTSLAMAVSIVLVLVLADPMNLEKDNYIIRILPVQQEMDESTANGKQISNLTAQISEEVKSGEIERQDETDALTLEAEASEALENSLEVEASEVMENQAESDEIPEEESVITVPEEEVTKQDMDSFVNGNEGGTEEEFREEDQTVSGNDMQDGGASEDTDRTVSSNEPDVSGSDTVSDNMAEAVPLMNIVSRNGGELEAGVFFASAGAWYEVEVAGGSSVSQGDNSDGLPGTVFCQIGDQEFSVQIQDGRAIIPLPEHVSGMLKLWNDQNQEELLEFVVVEQNAPEIHNEVVVKEDHLSYSEVVISETGDIVSGIKEYSFTLDGKPVEAQLEESGTLLTNADWGDWSPSQMNFFLPLMDMKEHELVVYASDYAGNVSEEAFQVKAEPQGVISVVLPTSFDILMHPGEDEPGVVESNDIIICNKSPFPIDVVVKTTKVSVYPNKDADGKEKSCNINLELLEAEQQKKAIMLQEGVQSDLMTFRLETVSTQTDSDELLAQASDRKHMKQIHSQDYATMRITGQMNTAKWEDGDLNVKIIFDFKRAETSEEAEDDL